MFGYGSRNELLSLSPMELSPEVQLDGSSSTNKANELIAKALEKGSHRFEWTAKRADNSEFPSEVLLTSIPSDSRQILHAVWRDISRQKAAEVELSKSREALQSQTEVLQSILHHMGDAVIVADKDYLFSETKDPAAIMAGVFARSLGVRRNSVVLPPGYELVACNVPAQVLQQPDGRVMVSFVNPGPDAASVVVKGRRLP
jgi:PAS domain-containing protein